MNHEILDTDHNGKTENFLSSEAIVFLSETRKWTKFLSILGFIALGFMVLLGLLMGTVLSKLPNVSTAGNIPTEYFTVIYLVIAVLNFFPVLYLFRFSNYLGRALKSNSSQDLTLAFSNLKSHYKFFGILAIIFLSFYALVFVGAIVVASFR